MLHSLVSGLDRLAGFDSASAHCDIPCKIYDPAVALVAALSVVRMMDILIELQEKPDHSTLDFKNSVARAVQQKEEQAEKVKHEIRVIWGDYFKAPQIEEHPGIHDLAHRIMMKASNCKQQVDRGDGLALVELVNEFATIFWATKGLDVKRVTSPYPPSLEVVSPVL